MIPSHSRRRSSKLLKVNQSSFSRRISLVKGRNSNVMLSFERSKCRFQWSTECLTGDFDPHYWPFRSKTTSEKAVQKELLWNLPMTIAGQRTGNIGSLHRGFVISRFFFIYFTIAGLQKNISLYRGLRFTEVSLYPVALLWMITVKDSISRPFTDLNTAKLYSIRNNQQKHNSVMPAFMWHSVAFPPCETVSVRTARITKRQQQITDPRSSR